MQSHLSFAIKRMRTYKRAKKWSVDEYILNRVGNRHNELFAIYYDFQDGKISKGKYVRHWDEFERDNGRWSSNASWYPIESFKTQCASHTCWMHIDSDKSVMEGLVYACDCDWIGAGGYSSCIWQKSDAIVLLGIYCLAKRIIDGFESSGDIWFQNRSISERWEHARAESAYCAVFFMRLKIPTRFIQGESFGVYVLLSEEKKGICQWIGWHFA